MTGPSEQRRLLVACLMKLCEAHSLLTGRDDYTPEDLALIDAIDEALFTVLEGLKRLHE